MTNELGSGKTTPQRTLDTFLLEHSDWGHVGKISFDTDELTALCPVTKQPDSYHCTIIYEPFERAIETKSLKLYLWSFRNEGVFCEHLARRIAMDVQEVTEATYVSVDLIQRVRGGITTTVSAYARGRTP